MEIGIGKLFIFPTATLYFPGGIIPGKRIRRFEYQFRAQFYKNINSILKHYIVKGYNVGDIENF